MTTSVFVIGDSISMHYGPFLQEFLGEAFDYARKTGEEPGVAEVEGINVPNGIDSSKVLQYVKIMAANSQWRPDVLLLNCGLHDIKRPVGDLDNYQVTLGSYRENLTEIFEIVKSVCGRVIWLRTTPVIDEVHNKPQMEFHRFGSDCESYNAAADEVAAAAGVTSIDLNAFTQTLGASEIFCDHVHYTDEVRKLQGAFIAGFLKALVA